MVFCQHVKQLLQILYISPHEKRAARRPPVFVVPSDAFFLEFFAYSHTIGARLICVSRDTAWLDNRREALQEVFIVSCIANPADNFKAVFPIKTDRSIYEFHVARDALRNVFNQRNVCFMQITLHGRNRPSYL